MVKVLGGVELFIFFKKKCIKWEKWEGAKSGFKLSGSKGEGIF